jgi:probable O-glycosylation ligase (exosortase A-associated)
MRDLMFASVWLALVPITIISAHSGILLWVWVALLSPNELLTGFMAGVPFNKIVAGVTLLLCFIRPDGRKFYLDLTLIVLGVFVVWAAISWQCSLVPNVLGDDLFWKLFKSAILAVMITGLMVSRHRIHLLVFTIVAAMSFLGVKEGLLAIGSVGGHKILGSSSIGDNNSLATALLMTIPLIWYLIGYSAVRLTRIGLMAALALSVVTIVATYSRGGFIGLLVLALLMVGTSKNKLTGILVLGAASVAIYAFAPDTWFDRLHTIATADDDSSFMGRVVAWKLSLLLALDHPLLGGGMHAIQNALVWNHYRPFFSRLDFIPTPPPDVTPHAAHSIYFEILGDTGFVGFALFCALMIICLINCSWIYRKARSHPQFVWAADLARMVQVSMILYLVTGAALSMGYFELLYILVALVSRCRRTIGLGLTMAADPFARSVASPGESGRVLGALGRPEFADLAGAEF